MKLLKLIPDDTNIKFLRWRVPFYAVSLLLMAASLALVFTNGLNFGVDFIGGQSIRATFVQDDEVPLAEVREEITALGYGEPTIQRLGQPNEISVRMGIPTCRAWRSGVLANATATRRVIRAPTLFASPGRALASWITMGIRRLRAARYMGVQT